MPVQKKKIMKSCVKIFGKRLRKIVVRGKLHIYTTKKKTSQKQHCLVLQNNVASRVER